MSEDKLKLLSCHFTWDLQKEDADLNFLEVKVREILAVKCEYGGKLKQREFNFLAFIKHLQGFNDEALKNLQLAKKEHPDDDSNVIVTYGNLAWVHSLMGNVTEAETYTEKVHEILRAFPAPSPAELHREVQSEKAWSLLKFSRKTYIRAKESFLEALQKEPDDKEWNTGFAFSLFRLEGLKIGPYKRVRFEESPAVLQLKKALNLDPENAMIHVYLGLKCYKNTKNGNNAEAWQYMTQALASRTFKQYRLGSERAAVEHYKQGMMLGRVSTEWMACRNRLRKVLQHDRRDTYEIRMLFHSFRTENQDD
ncbi:interferon-induced protein with tetratricopeptide repeats 1-like [Carassius carassius]|uniref:interferon-induced protein with tetratricopeptide repeats 1-like n=1 Tax=Carassius carassius TaxID=217509 RepID=UPI00286915E6|nr:interferon-induced protein with tetratricopeptide repeats 1-like [Carassius carassius]